MSFRVLKKEILIYCYQSISYNYWHDNVVCPSVCAACIVAKQYILQQLS